MIKDRQRPKSTRTATSYLVYCWVDWKHKAGEWEFLISFLDEGLALSYIRNKKKNLVRHAVKYGVVKKKTVITTSEIREI